MDVADFIFIILFVVIFLPIAVLQAKIQQKRLLVLPQYMNDLQDALHSINSCQTVQDLKEVVGEAIRSNKRYHHLLALAGKKRAEEITQKPLVPFKKRERRARAIWLPVFIMYSLYFVILSLTHKIGTRNFSNLASMMSFIVGFVSPQFLILWSVYHCAYSEKGNKLISFVFTICMLMYMIQIGEHFRYNHDILQRALSMGLFLLWIVPCYLLIKVNTEFKATKQLAYVHDYLKNQTESSEKAH